MARLPKFIGKYLDKTNKYRKQPPGPLIGLWTWRYLDWFKTARMISSKRVRTYYKDFPGTLPPGSAFPEIVHETIEGSTINTRDFLHKKHLVLFTGASTCPPFRRSLGPMDQLREKYKNRDVEVLALYVREPHAGERGFREYEDHKNFEHKTRYAQSLAGEKSIQLPVLIDGIDERTHELLGNLPNLVYVIDKEGKVAFKATWLDVEDVDHVLAELVTKDDPANPVAPTLTLSGLPTEI